MLIDQIDQNLDNILAQKNAFLIPDNIKEDVTILGITGTLHAGGIDTEDATALEGDIASGKTAYVKGEKITGTIEIIHEGQILECEEVQNANISLRFIIPSKAILEQGAKVAVDNMLIASTIGLTPEKLLIGNTILGVEGTLEPKVDPILESVTKTYDANGIYTIVPSEGYDAIGNVNVTVDVHEHVQHMPYYFIETDENGDLWCVTSYDEMGYVPYSMDQDGNLILEQDDDDLSEYSLNEDNELEVLINV